MLSNSTSSNRRPPPGAQRSGNRSQKPVPGDGSGIGMGQGGLGQPSQMTTPASSGHRSRSSGTPSPSRSPVAQRIGIRAQRGSRGIGLGITKPAGQPPLQPTPHRSGQASLVSGIPSPSRSELATGQPSGAGPGSSGQPSLASATPSPSRSPLSMTGQPRFATGPA